MRSFKSTAKGILDSERASSAILTAVIIATVLAFNIVIFALANIFTLSFTVQEKDKVVLTGNTDDLFAEAISQKKKVKIYFCFPSEDDLLYHETGAFVHKTAQEYKARYSEFIDIDYLNLITRVDSKGNDISEKIQKWQVDEKGNKNHLAKGSVIFECGENYKVVTDTYSTAAFADFYTLDGSGNVTSYNGEAFMASMIYWVTVKEHPTAYFTVGHSEQLDRAFATLLMSAGYVIDTIDLKTEEVPTDEANLLIISNPLSDFEKALEGRTEMDNLETYVENGGNVYVSLDPYVKNLPVIEEFLRTYGIEFSETESDGTVIRNIIKDSNQGISTDGFTLVTDFADNDIAKKIGETVSGYSDGNVIVREAAALKLSKDAKPLLVSTSASNLEAGGESVDSKGTYPVAACVKIDGVRDKVASLCVVSSVYISVSDALITNGYANTDFLYSLFDNFYGQNGMPYGCDVMKSDTSILENLTMGTARVYTAIILALPVAVAVVGAVVVNKRKNR